MRDLLELNIHVYPGDIARAPPDVGAIQAFEREFNLTIPKIYLEILKAYNGGYPELCVIRPIDRPDAADWVVNHFYHLDSDRDSPESLWTATKAWRHRLSGDFLPFAEDPNGNPFLLDLETEPPSIRACLHDESSEVVDLAPDFEHFIDALAPNVDEE